MIENIEVQDVITLDDDKEYVVAGKAVYDNVNYLHLVNIEDFSVKFAALSDDKVIILKNKEDRNLIDELTPQFLDSASKAFAQLVANKE